MSCECNINLVKTLEKKYPRIKIYNLQYCCTKCHCFSQSIKNTEKGVGFVTWAKNLFKKLEIKAPVEER